MPALENEPTDGDFADPLATISRLRECWFDLEWHPQRRPAVEARRDRIVAHLHSIAVARLRGAGRPSVVPRAAR